MNSSIDFIQYGSVRKDFDDAADEKSDNNMYNRTQCGHDKRDFNDRADGKFESKYEK